MDIAHTTAVPRELQSNTNIDEIQSVNTLTESRVEGIIAKWYLDGKADSRIAQRAYNVIAQINDVWYDQISVPVNWQSDDPYSSFEDMRRTVRQEDILRVFAGGSEPEHMSKDDTIKGRAVHDWFGHLERDCDFSLTGEWQKYQHVKHRYPEWTHGLLFSEIVGQRAIAGHLPDGFGDSRFEQKPLFAPRHIRELSREVLR